MDLITRSFVVRETSGCGHCPQPLLEKAMPGTAIGVVLPPGKGGVVANLAMVLAGKVPVNLNFTSGRDSIESAKEQAGLRTIITARVLAKSIGGVSLDAGA